jgi:hypothetical protein
MFTSEVCRIETSRPRSFRRRISAVPSRDPSSTTMISLDRHPVHLLDDLGDGGALVVDRDDDRELERMGRCGGARAGLQGGVGDRGVVRGARVVRGVWPHIAGSASRTGGTRRSRVG